MFLSNIYAELFWQLAHLYLNSIRVIFIRQHSYGGVCLSVDVERFMSFSDTLLEPWDKHRMSD